MAVLGMVQHAHIHQLLKKNVLLKVVLGMVQLVHIHQILVEEPEVIPVMVETKEAPEVETRVVPEMKTKVAMLVHRHKILPLS